MSRQVNRLTGKRSYSCMAKAFPATIGHARSPCFRPMVIVSWRRINSASGKSAKPDIRYSFDLLARNIKVLLYGLGVTRAAIIGHSFGGMLAVYFARDYPEMTAVLALENPIGLEDYRSAIPPQPIETLFKTEMAQTPESYHTFMQGFFVGWPPAAQHYVDIFSRVLLSPEYPR